jgi:enoyl-CoA hydratase/3-hydroxyacyl-CoA dehydrogenase
MPVKNITVLGSGIMGHGIAQVAATAGYKSNKNF